MRYRVDYNGDVAYVEATSAMSAASIVVNQWEGLLPYVNANDNGDDRATLISGHDGWLLAVVEPA